MTGLLCKEPSLTSSLFYFGAMQLNYVQMWFGIVLLKQTQSFQKLYIYHLNSSHSSALAFKDASVAHALCPLHSCNTENADF